MQSFLKSPKTTSVAKQENFEDISLKEFQGLFPLMSMELRSLLIIAFQEKVRVLSVYAKKGRRVAPNY